MLKTLWFFFKKNLHLRATKLSNRNVSYFSFRLLPNFLFTKLSFVLIVTQFFSVIYDRNSVNPFSRIISIAFPRLVLETHSPNRMNKGLYSLQLFVAANFVQSAQVKNPFSAQHCFTLQFFIPTAHLGELPLQPSHFPDKYVGQAPQ